MNHSVRIVKLSLIVLILLAIFFELMVWYRGGVPLTNQLYRVISGAPEIHVDGQLLMYSGTFLEKKDYFIPYKVSSEGVQLYKSTGIGDMPYPPWIYVIRENKAAYRYKIPHPIFQFRAFNRISPSGGILCQSVSIKKENG
jgi:hypothetical protein